MALIGETSVSGVEIDADRADRTGRRLRQFHPRAAAIALGEGIRLRKLLPSDESLESVFSYLLEA